MNARDIVHYGHQHLLDAIKDLPEGHWTVPGATTRWSIKDVLAHLASFELWLEDALKFAAGETPTPTLDTMARVRDGFNEAEVARRAALPPGKVMEEYTAAHERVMARIEALGPERLAATGTIPWYGPGYSLDDFIVYTNYGHKREHCAQIRRFRQTL